MKNLKHSQFALLGINILLGILAYQGLFEGKDLLPILIGGVLALLGFLLLWITRSTHFRYQLRGFVFVLLSSAGLYHIHFNIYNAQKRSKSREGSSEILAGNKAPSLTFEYHFNISDSLSTQAYMAHKKFTILSFWATWCAPCLKEMPLLEDFYQKNREGGLGLIGFTDFSNKKDSELLKIKKVIDKLGISYPILVDTSTKVRSAYQADVLPATVLLDHEGQVLDYQIGLNGAKKIMQYVQEHL